MLVYISYIDCSELSEHGRKKDARINFSNERAICGIYEGHSEIPTDVDIIKIEASRLHQHIN